MIGFISNVCICVTLMFQFDQLRLLQRYFCNDLDHEKINKGTSIFGTLDYLLVHWLTSKKKRKKKKNRPPCCGWPIDFRGPFVTKKKTKKILDLFCIFFRRFRVETYRKHRLVCCFLFPRLLFDHPIHQNGFERTIDFFSFLRFFFS